MYKVYIKNIFFSKIFWISIIITLLTFIAGSYQSLIVQDEALECYQCAAVYGSGHIVAMVLSPLPFLVIFSDEIIKLLELVKENTYLIKLWLFLHRLWEWDLLYCSFFF